MNYFSRRSGVAIVLALGASAALATAWCDRSGRVAEREAALTPSGAVRARAANHATSPSIRTALPVLEPAAIPIEVDGTAIAAIDVTALLQRHSTLTAGDRRAWRLSELLPSTHMASTAVIHALTNDDQDYIIQEPGRRAGDAILVRRNTGELYIGWLDGDTATRPLADAERPAERIENLSRISITTPIVPDHLPARLTVVIDGKPASTLTPQSFPDAATIQIRGQRDGAAAAIDIARAFGATLHLVGLTAGGARVTSPAPAPDARAVIYLTRRGQFKFAWIDPSGEPLANTKQRDVTELALATTPRLATRP
jgi:hypothetical protein